MIFNSNLVWRKLYRLYIEKALSLYPSPTTYDLSNLRHLIKYLLVYQFAMFCYEHSCSCIMFWLTNVYQYLVLVSLVYIQKWNCSWGMHIVQLQQIFFAKVFQSGCADLHSLKQCMVSFIFPILAILMGVVLQNFYSSSVTSQLMFHSSCSKSCSLIHLFIKKIFIEHSVYQLLCQFLGLSPMPTFLPFSG